VNEEASATGKEKNKNSEVKKILIPLHVSTLQKSQNYVEKVGVLWIFYRL